MNDFELHYLYNSRSLELIAQADNERLAAEHRRGAGNHRREGIAARLAASLHRKDGQGVRRARRFQLAK